MVGECSDALATKMKNDAAFSDNGVVIFFSMLQKLSIEVVELDPSISDIAKSWFQLKEDERMKVIIQDGLEYIRSKGWLLLFVI